jgi:hypothetical protein
MKQALIKEGHDITVLLNQYSLSYTNGLKKRRIPLFNKMA